MAIKIYKRNSAGRRNMSVVKPSMITRTGAEKSLTFGLSNKSGRSRGKISVRHKGGRAKRTYRIVDFYQNKFNIPGTVAAIERDPNRSALIALIHYIDGEKRYILATDGMTVGQRVLSGPEATIEEGNRIQLKNIPSGTTVCNVELFSGKGGQIARSAGSYVTLMALDRSKAQLKLASGEIRLVPEDCCATIGRISNFEHSSRKIGKAGRSRHLGRRPAVRGSAMNPVDHPHGGGEGRQPIGLKYPKTPWGKHALGVHTRRKKRYSDRLIVQRRKKNR